MASRGRLKGKSNPPIHGPGERSQVKLVNPPVALMFLEGAQRLAAAGVHVPGLRDGDRKRVALEAYPGFAVRQLSGGGRPGSYKNDARIKQTPEQRSLRRRIVKQVVNGELGGIGLDAPQTLLDSLVADEIGRAHV